MTRLAGLGGFDRRAALAASLLVLALALTSLPVAGEDPAQTVRLVVDYGDGATKTVNNLTWAKGNTVLDAMKAATARPHGISFSYTGADSAAVLTRIDDVPNEGGGAGKKNWQYWVNDAYGDRSFAIFELQAQDVVVWRYATEQGK
jgi:Domain of unknown function (DUF4430)